MLIKGEGTLSQINKTKNKNMIIKKNIDPNCYSTIIYPKKQIVLHHTVSGDNINGIIAHFEKNKSNKIAVAYCINRKGEIFNLFDDKYHANHLGLTTKHFQQFKLPYQNLNLSTIGIELLSWGALKKGTDGYYYPIQYINNPKVRIAGQCPQFEYSQIESNCSCVEEYRGYKYFEKYTKEQLNSLKILLQQLCTKYQIPKKYNPIMNSCDINALKGEKGIFTHAAYRPDKSDLSPQFELIKILKNL